MKRQWRETVRRGESVYELAEKLGAFENIARAHGNDIAAAELAFDRWASHRLLEEVRKLPRREVLTRKLVESIVRERDAASCRPVRGHPARAAWKAAVRPAGSRRYVVQALHARVFVSRGLGFG